LLCSLYVKVDIMKIELLYTQKHTLIHYFKTNLLIFFICIISYSETVLFNLIIYKIIHIYLSIILELKNFSYYKLQLCNSVVSCF